MDRDREPGAAESWVDLVSRESRQSGGALAALLTLALLADASGRASPPVRALAARCRVSERAMFKTLAGLVQAGEIAPVGKNKTGVVVYQLLPAHTVRGNGDLNWGA